MAINLNGSFTSSAQLIADTGLLFGPLDASNDYAQFPLGNRNAPTQLSPGALPPSLTRVVPVGDIFPLTVSAALEINSVSGGFLMPRMTTTQRNLLTVTNGMQVYNTTTDSVDLFIGGTWVQFASGAGLGNVVGPVGAVEDNIAIFGDDTGLLIDDSGIPITQVPIVAVTSLSSSLVDANQIGNLGYIQFSSAQSPAVFVDSLSPFNFIENDYGPGTQSSTIFTGGIPASGSSVSALVELSSDTGVLLLSRLTNAELTGLPGLVRGMIAYNSDAFAVQVYQGDTPAWQSLGTVNSVGATGFLTTSIAGNEPITQTGTLTIANGTPERLIGFDMTTGNPVNVSVDGTTIVWGAGNILRAVAAETGVTSVANIDGTLTISPETGAVIASVSSTYPGNTSLHTLGTVTTGTWHGNRIDILHGGTNTTSFVDGSLIACAEDGSQLVSLASGSPSQILQSLGSDLLPQWVDFDAIGVSSIVSSNGSLTVSTPTGNVNIELNVSDLTDFQLIALDGSGLLTSVSAGLLNQVLISQGPGVLPIWGNQSGSGTVTSVGGSGGITTSPIPITGAGTVSLANPSTFAVANTATLFGAVVSGGNVISTVNIGAINWISTASGTPNTNLSIGVNNFNVAIAGGLRNLGIGAECLTGLTAGCSGNIAMGTNVLSFIGGFAESDSNIAIGTDVAQNLGNGSSNIIIGGGAFNLAQGTSLVAVSNNVVIGAGAATTPNFPNFCTFIGAQADSSSSITPITNSTAIGYNASVAANNQMVLGYQNSVGIGANALEGPKYTLDLGNIPNLTPPSCGIRLAATTNIPAVPTHTNDFVIFNNAGVPSYRGTDGVVHPIGAGAVDITGATDGGITVNPSPLIGTGTVGVTDLILTDAGTNIESWFWGYQSGTVSTAPVVGQCIAVGAASLTNIYQATGGSGPNENGNRNIGIGANTLSFLVGGAVPGGGTIGNDNIALGVESLFNLQFLGGVIFSNDYSHNIGIGTYSLGNLNKVLFPSGIFEAQGNIGIGTYAGTALGAGSLNTFFGFQTGLPIGGINGTTYQLDTCTLIGAETSYIPSGGVGSGITLIGSNVACISAVGAAALGSSIIIGNSNVVTAVGSLAQIGSLADGATSLGAQTVIPNSAQAATALGFRAQPNFPNSTALGANVTVNVANACTIGSNQFVGINTDSPAYALDVAPVAPGGVGTAIAAIQLQSNGVNVPATPSTNNIVIYNAGSKPSVEFDDSSVMTLLSKVPSANGTFFFPTIILNTNGSIGIVNNGYEDNSNYNFFIGHNTGNGSLTGINNYGTGISCMPSITTGNSNSGAGGRGVLFSVTTASENTAYGCFSLNSTISDIRNTGIGAFSLFVLGDAGGSGNNNTALGYSSALTQNSYSNCTFLGSGTDATVNSLTNATAIGYNTKVAISNALVLGAGAAVGAGQSSPIYSLDLGNISTLSPVSCGMRLAASSNIPSTPANTNDVVIFNDAGAPSYVDTTGTVYPFSIGPSSPLTPGNYPFADITVNGSGAITAISAAGIYDTANNNIYIGVGSGINSTTPVLNCGYGFNSLNSVTLGGNNCSYGSYTLSSIVTAASNSAFGDTALRFCTTGLNSAFGAASSSTNTDGQYNSSFGALSLIQCDHSSYNLAAGYQAGYNQALYTNCTFLGTQSDASINGLTNAAAIGYQSSVGASNSMVLGGTGGNQVNVGIGTTTPQAMLHVAGGQIINRTPVASASSPYTVLVTDYIIGVTDTAAAVSIVLPAPTADNTGQVFIVKDESGAANVNNIQVTVDGGANIDGTTLATISVAYASISFYSNGTTYNIF